jgi:predicted O-methyltransferase YrrM
VVVETGVGLGTSSLFILQALEDNGMGKLYSIDEPYAEYQSDAGITINESSYCANDDQPGMLVPTELRDRWILLLGKSYKLLPELCERLRSLDFFFHDSEHTYRNMYQEYTIVWPYLCKRGVLASHDVEWNTAFQDFANAILRQTIVSRNLGLILA